MNYITVCKIIVGGSAALAVAGLNYQSDRPSAGGQYIASSSSQGVKGWSMDKHRVYAACLEYGKQNYPKLWLPERAQACNGFVEGME
jgi:hypothetical protein